MEDKPEKTVKNREATEQSLLDAVHELVAESGFESLGVNAVAAKAGVSKMLIYRYFESMDGLIAAYIKQHDYWINIKDEVPENTHLKDYVKNLFIGQIDLLRNNLTLRRLYRWELNTDNPLIKEIGEERETKGVERIKTVSRITGVPEREVAVMATILTSSISYLVLVEDNCPVYNGIKIQEEDGWQQLKEGINSLIELWFNTIK